MRETIRGVPAAIFERPCQQAALQIASREGTGVPADP